MGQQQVLTTPAPLPHLTWEDDHVAQPRSKAFRTSLRVMVALSVVVGLLIAASYVVRSEWFLRSRIDPKLERMGKKLHGTFQYESVSPVGFTGVRLDGLTFVPTDDPEVAAPLAIEKLVVYPDLGAMILGDMQPESLEIHGLDAEFWLDGGTSGRGHWPWLEAVVETWKDTDPNKEKGGNGAGDKRPFPDITVFDGRIDLVSPHGSMPEIGASVEELSVTMIDDQLDLDGAILIDGLGYALLKGGASRTSRTAGMVVELEEGHDLLALAPGDDMIRDVVGSQSKLAVGGVSVAWPPAVTIHDVAVTDTHIGVPGHDEAYIESVGASEISFGFDDEQASMTVKELDASVRVEWMEGLGASIPIHLPRFDALMDFDAHRIGAGFAVKTEDGRLDLSAALDLSARDLALKVKADHFDAGRLLSFLPYTGPLEVTSGIVDGHVHVRYPLEAGLVRVDTFLNMSNLTVDVPWVTDQTMTNAEVTIDVDAIVDIRERRLRFEDGGLSVGELMFSASADIRQLEGRDIAIEASLHGDDLPAADALESLPDGFAPALEGYELAGNFDVAMELALDTRHPDDINLEHELDLSELVVEQHGPRADIPVLATDDFMIKVSTATDGATISPASAVTWTPYWRVPRHFISALVASEDGRFYSHNGFDERAIHKSIVANLSAGRIVRGGSTISQQVTKNLFLSQRKTLSRKLQEAFITWQLEAHVPKRRIIELYLNLAHWGPDIYGVREASRYYFDKRPGQLTIRESLFLASILPNPIRFGGQYLEGTIRADRLDKMRNGLLILYRKGHMTREAYEHNLHRLNRAAISSTGAPSAEVANQRIADASG